MKTAIFALASIIVLTLALPSAAFLAAPSNSQHQVQWIRVASVSSLPEDGTPRLMPIRLARRVDWTRMPEETIGHVFLRRTPEAGAVVALTPHHSRGAAVAYDVEKRCFRCTCWGVEFDRNGNPLEGARDDSAPRIRRVEAIVLGGEIFVRHPPGE